MAKWAQHEIKLPAFSRGCHLVTDQARLAFGHKPICPCVTRAYALCLLLQIQKQISSSLSDYKVGLANIFCVVACTERLLLSFP